MDKSTAHDKSLFDLFLPGMNVKENVFFLQSASLKRHCVTRWCEQRGMNSYQQWQIVVKFNIPLFYRYFYNHLSNYTKTIIRLRLVNIGEYSPIFTSPSANNCFNNLKIYLENREQCGNWSRQFRVFGAWHLAEWQEKSTRAYLFQIACTRNHVITYTNTRDRFLW